MDSKKATENKATAEERRKKKAELFEKAQKEINKEFGTGSVIPVNGNLDVETISTGSWSIDSILGGGFPRGRLIEIYGKEASGKTSIALNAIADVQRKGGNAVFIDLENALDPRYAKQLGVDIDKLIASRPENGEQAEMIMEKFIESGSVDIIVLDSVAAMVSQKELEGDITKDTMALRARLMSKLCGRIVHPAAVTGTAVIFTNQLRTKIGGFSPTGDPTDTTGGKALKYAATQRIQVRRGKQEVDPKTGLIIRTPLNVKVVKNKIAPPLLSCETFLANGKGIDKDNELFDLCEKFGIIKRSGSYYKDGDTGETLGQGKPSIIKKIESNEDGIKDKYIPRMLERLEQVGSADTNDIIEDAISRGDDDIVESMRSNTRISNRKISDSEDDD
jgi:recombination protein RecA